jgi:hypothetical protein
MFPGMDANTLMQMFGMLFGGQGGGGAQGGAMAPQPAIPNVAGAGALPMSTDASAMQPSMDSTTGMPTGAPPMPPNAAPMSARPGVNYAPQTQTMNTLGDALEPRPAPGIPIPQPRPADLGAGTPGYYGGSPETNPNLKPMGSTAGAGGQTSRAPMDIAKLLGGIKQPTGPDVVKPSTPAAPQRGQMGGSELMSLLQALMPGIGRGLRSPTTLGQAMELKPSAWGGIYG